MNINMKGAWSLNPRTLRTHPLCSNQLGQSKHAGDNVLMKKQAYDEGLLSYKIRRIDSAKNI
jgi:hypothetical protein